jgi:hypothetical protein
LVDGLYRLKCVPNPLVFITLSKMYFCQRLRFWSPIRKICTHIWLSIKFRTLWMGSPDFLYSSYVLTYSAMKLFSYHLNQASSTKFWILSHLSFVAPVLCF